MPRILNLDPGLEWVGYSICEVTRHGESILAMGLIRTEKSAKKENVRVADDTFRRARYISRQLLDLVREFDIKLICFENFSPPRNSSVAGKLGYVYGSISMLTEVFNLPVAAATPQAIKKAVCGKVGASKDDVTIAIKRRYRTRSNFKVIQQFEQDYSQVPKNWNHAWDSLGAMISCADNDALRVLRQAT